MLISTFQGVDPFPKTKEAKRKEAFKLGDSYDKETGQLFHEAILPDLVEISSEEDLINTVTSNAWSPFVFSGKKIQDNFVSTDFAVLDIDEGLSIEEAQKRVTEANITCLCLTTTSHKADKPRFRLIFPLAQTIKNVKIYKATMEELREAFPESDKACVTDTARLYFGSTKEDGFWYEGDLLIPTFPKKEDIRERSKYVLTNLSYKEIIDHLYGEDRRYIPESVAYFVENAHTGMDGEWTTSLNRCCYTLALSGLTYDDIYFFIQEVAPDPLSKSDIKTIKYACRDGERDKFEYDLSKDKET